MGFTVFKERPGKEPLVLFDDSIPSHKIGRTVIFQDLGRKPISFDTKNAAEKWLKGFLEEFAGYHYPKNSTYRVVDIT